MTSPSSQCPRVALIGISGYGRIHLQLALECHRQGLIRLVAAAEINSGEMAATVAELRSLGCEIHDDYVAMLRRHRGALELCLIPTGIHLHSRMTIDALEAGANVLVEKPVACSASEVEAMRAAERAAGRFVAVGFQDFYSPATAWLKSELIGHAIGELRSARFLGLWPRPRAYFTRNNWAGRLRVDGRPVLDSPLSNAFAHFIMLSLYFADPRAGSAAAATLQHAELFRAHDIESFDTGVAAFRTAEGVELWFGASHACREALEPEIILTGTKGEARWSHESFARVCRHDGTEDRRPVPDSTQARRLMMATVLQRLRDPRVAVCTIDLAARHTEAIEALHRNAVIHSFPSSQIEWIGGGNGAAIPVVHGLEAALRTAFDRQSTLREAGFLPMVAAGRS